MEQTDAANADKLTAEDGPIRLSDLTAKSWWQALLRAGKQFNEDHLTVWAAALTYYGVLSVFPALLVFIAALRLTGQNTTDRILQDLTSTAPGPTHTVLTDAVKNLQQGQQSTAGVLAVIGIAGALWSASSYIGAFMQASNAIFDVPEGRPLWKKLPIRLGITIAVGLVVVVGALSVVFTGSLARHVGNLLDIGPGAVATWDVLKWPALAIIVGLLFAMMYWASPNAKQGGFRWATPGSLVAVVIWIVASAGFALYVANFASYNRTYGSLAAVIIFLVWMWITNLAILFGAEFDAEMQRSRAIVAGHPVDEEPYMELRDTRKVSPATNSDL